MSVRPSQSTSALISALIVVVGMLASRAPTVLAQAPDSELKAASPSELSTGFSDLIEVSEVFLDVLATDDDGQVVRGLKAEDFEILEDGQPVAITSLSYYSTRYGDADANEGDIPSSRFILLFFHNQTRTGRYGVARLFRQQIRATFGAREWVREHMMPSDWVAVVSYGTRLVVHQDFTQDAEALDKALSNASTGKSSRADQRSIRERRERGRELGILSRLPTGNALKQAAPNIYKAIEVVAGATGNLIGRKTMLLYTLGFGVERGRDSLPDPVLYPELEPILNDHNVAVYPIDMTPAGSSPDHEDFLERLATDTGGFYDPDFNGFVRPIESVTDENQGYYLVSYRSPRPAGEIGYQRLEVVAKNPAVHLRARTGYRYGL